eukprot:scaffold5181_cov62-Cyclotella_meneghiniana.AAC.3
MKRTAIILAISASTIDASSPSIRGGVSNNNNNKRINHNNNNNRPAIRDERQIDKIRRYNRQRKLSDGVASMMSHHTKNSFKQYAGTSGIHVKVQQGEDELGFQTPPSQTVDNDNNNNSGGGETTSSSSSEMPLPQYQTVHQYYYPSFDMDLYPNGACLNDGQHPTSYSLTPSQFLFDTIMDCCEEWFVDVKSCLSVGNNVEEAMMVPTSFPTWDNESGGGGSPWPTWSDDVFQDDDKTTTTTTDSTETTSTSSATEAASTTSTGGIDTTTTEDTVESIDTDDVFNYFVDNDNTQFQGSSGSSSNSQQDHQNQASSNTSDNSDSTSSHYTFYESFENGDFTSHPWKLTSSSPSSNIAVDPWSAERTAIAYQGRYAARPGILSTPSTVTNLTISLNDLNDDGSADHGVFTGGLLRFAIHAAVDLPVDALYFSINDHVIRKFTSPTGYEEGDWEEVSTLLLPGEHTLSWSYQFYGGEDDTVDPRRVGNSWIDDIELIPYTGDYALREGQTDVLDMTSGVSPWNVVHDPNAFNGDKSFIAYTQDIVSNQGSIDMSWTVVVSPDGGLMSFAVYASVYAPHDVLEFSVDNIPKAVITTPTSNWQEYEVEMDPGRHVCTWRLIKNVPGLGSSLLNGVDVPEGYQGYVKVDGIKYEDRMRDVITTEAPVTTTTEETTTSTTEEPTTTMAVTTSTIEATTSSTAVETTEAPKETTSEATAVDDDDDDDESTTSLTTEAPEVVSTTSTTAETLQDSNEEEEEEEEANNTSEMTSNTAQADGCPEGLVQVDGLPGCCVEEPNYLGDGACDPWAPYNTEACGYDLGDCCQDTCNEDSPYGCHTKEGAEYGPFGFFCLDPRSASIVIDAEKCLVENREWIGDGGCDGGSEYNTPECGYDGGDCCEGTCDDDFAFYTCGANQPYECLSEDR